MNAHVQIVIDGFAGKDKQSKGIDTLSNDEKLIVVVGATGTIVPTWARIRTTELRLQTE